MCYSLHDKMIVFMNYFYFMCNLYYQIVFFYPELNMQISKYIITVSIKKRHFYFSTNFYLKKSKLYCYVNNVLSSKNKNRAFIFSLTEYAIKFVYTTDNHNDIIIMLYYMTLPSKITVIDVYEYTKEIENSIYKLLIL